MADIPVEKKSSSSWLPWIIGLLVLIGLIWLLSEVFFDEEDEADDLGQATEQVEPRSNETASAAAAGGVITSVATILNAENPSQLAGRQVQLSDMNVTSVLGDSAFYAVPPNDNRRFLIALNEQIPTPPSGTEGRYDVTEGQVVNVDGGIRELTNEADAWGLSEDEAQEMQNDAIYIRAQSLDIVEQTTN